MEATADLLKELNIKTIKRNDDDDDDDDDAEFDMETEGTTITGSSSMEVNELDTDMEVADSKVVGKEHVDSGDESSHQEQPEAENATSYELITGLLHPGDWPEESYNVRRLSLIHI